MKKIKKLFRRSFFSKIARPGEIKEAIQALHFWELVFVIVSLIILFICTFLMASSVIKKTTVEFPSYGGSIKEGIVGQPHVFNPLLSVRDEDRDVVALVFSGLLRKNGDSYVNDLASEVARSKDGKTVTVTLKPDLKFQNGDDLTADDIIFTTSLAKDPKIKSPLKVIWDPVTVTKKDDLTVVFSLKQPYGAIDSMLTLGILSEDVFKNYPREDFPVLKEHQKPIGAGPYKVVSIKTKDDSIKSINLKRFKKYDPKAFIKNIKITYFDDEGSLVKAFKRGDVNIASGVSPESTKKESLIFTSNLNRTFALFINRSRVTYDQKTIEAISLLIPRELITSEALQNYADPIYAPYPTDESKNGPDVKERVEKALSLIEQSGWKHSEDGTYIKGDKSGTKILSVSITSPDTAELRKVGDRITTAFRDVGIETNITYINPTIFADEIIRPREFDFVLFGQVLHTPSDLYAFWHSSQKNDPGLNIGGYSNKTIDNKLESLLRETDATKQAKAIEEINTLIRNDVGAIFIFSPKYIILSDNKTSLVLPEQMSRPEDRYQNIFLWSVEKEKVLKFFNK